MIFIYCILTVWQCWIIRWRIVAWLHCCSVILSFVNLLEVNVMIVLYNTCGFCCLNDDVAWFVVDELVGWCCCCNLFLVLSIGCRFFWVLIRFFNLIWISYDVHMFVCICKVRMVCLSAMCLHNFNFVCWDIFLFVFNYLFCFFIFLIFSSIFCAMHIFCLRAILLWNYFVMLDCGLLVYCCVPLRFGRYRSTSPPGGNHVDGLPRALCLPHAHHMAMFFDLTKWHCFCLCYNELTSPSSSSPAKAVALAQQAAPDRAQKNDAKHSSYEKILLPAEGSKLAPCHGNEC